MNVNGTVSTAQTAPHGRGDTRAAWGWGMVFLVALLALMGCTSNDPARPGEVPDNLPDAAAPGPSFDAGSTPGPSMPPRTQEDPDFRMFLPRGATGDQGSMPVCHDRNFRNGFQRVPRTMRVRVHTLRPPGAAWTVTDGDRTALLARLNEAFIPIRLSFQLAGHTEEMTDLADVPSENMAQRLEALIAPRESADSLDVFILNSLGGSAWAGWGYFTFLGHHSVVLVRNYLATSTAVHEVGHALDLFHPHERAYGVEPADRAALCVQGGTDRACCEVRGDLLCSTPSDHEELCTETAGCDAVCTGVAADFRPDVTNLMGYHHACRNAFTDEQYQVMLCTAVASRSALLSSSACGACPTPPNACDGPNTRREYQSATCDEASGVCRPMFRDVPCPYGCANGACLGCMPSCNGRRCGGDGCGGVCGPGCASDEECVAGACVYRCPADRGCSREGSACTAARDGVITCTRNARNSACFDSVTTPCRSGETCVDGRCVCAPGFVACRGSCVPVVTEMCNGRDDNCDGRIDEGCPTGLSVRASVNSPIYGGPGGGAFSLSCPAGWVVTGVHGRSGDWMDSLGVVCRRPMLSPPTGSRPTFAVLFQDERCTSTIMLDVPPGICWRRPQGGTGGAPFSFSCPDGAAISEVDVGYGSRFTTSVDSLRFRCSWYTISGAPGSFVIQRAPAVQSPLYGMTRGTSAIVRASATGVITSVFGRSGASLDAVGFVTSDLALQF